MNERTIHVRLVGGISENRERYISTGSFAPPASIGDISQIRGHIHDIVVEYAEQWINDTDSPGEIETLEFTLSPAYINILTPNDVEWLQELIPAAETTIRYSNNPRDRR